MKQGKKVSQTYCGPTLLFQLAFIAIACARSKVITPRRRATGGAVLSCQLRRTAVKIDKFCPVCLRLALAFWADKMTFKGPRPQLCLVRSFWNSRDKRRLLVWCGRCRDPRTLVKNNWYKPWLCVSLGCRADRRQDYYWSAPIIFLLVRDPNEAQLSIYGGLGPLGSRIRAFERFEECKGMIFWSKLGFAFWP